MINEKIVWQQDAQEKKFFYSEQYNKEASWLRMNNFPEEPLWTLFYNGKEENFDDTPPNWEVIYLSEINEA